MLYHDLMITKDVSSEFLFKTANNHRRRKLDNQIGVTTMTYLSLLGLLLFL